MHKLRFLVANLLQQRQVSRFLVTFVQQQGGSRHRFGEVRIQPVFINVVEVRGELVIFPLTDWVVLVVVTAGASRVSPSTADPIVRTRSATYSTRNSSSMLPPSFVWR